MILNFGDCIMSKCRCITDCSNVKGHDCFLSLKKSSPPPFFFFFVFSECLLFHKCSLETIFLKTETHIEDIEILTTQFSNLWVSGYLLQNWRCDFLETMFFNSIPDIFQQEINFLVGFFKWKFIYFPSAWLTTFYKN